MKKLLALFLIVGILGFYNPVFAAWAATENFDSYVAGASISGDNGGSGWSSSWTLDSGTVKTDTAISGGQGGLAWHTSGTGDNRADRSFTSTSVGTMHYQFYLTGTNAGTTEYIILRRTTTGVMGIEINHSSGQVAATDNESFTTDVGSFNTNAWNTIDFKYGHNSGKFAISINGGTYSSDFTAFSSNTSVDNLFIIDLFPATHDFYLDDIRDGSGGGGSTPPNNDFEWFWSVF